jgi:hypothetical protein
MNNDNQNQEVKKIKVQNNIIGRGTEEISDKLTEFFESREEQDIMNFPSVLIAKYSKNQTTGRLEKTFLYGQIETPVTLYTECDEGDTDVHIATKGNRYILFTPDGEKNTAKGPLNVPSFVKVVDAKKYIEEKQTEKQKNIDLPAGEFVVNMYIGKDAFDVMQRVSSLYKKN